MRTKRSQEDRLFSQHRQNSRNRKIDFLFAKDEWIEWWLKNLGSQWMRRRGRKRGHYVMARKGDVGPYASWNVDCVFTEFNSSKKGEENGFSKLTEPVVKRIYLAKGRLIDVAKRFEIDFHTVYDIKTGRYWGHVTKGLGPAVLRKAAKLTKEQVLEIYKSHQDRSALMAKYGVSRNTISAIQCRQQWKSLLKDSPPRSTYLPKP